MLLAGFYCYPAGDVRQNRDVAVCLHLSEPVIGRPDCTIIILVTSGQFSEPVVLSDSLSVQDSGSSTEIQSGAMTEERSDCPAIFGVCSSTVSCYIVGDYTVICSGFVAG